MTDIHADPTNWLRTGLSDYSLKQIGLITIIWNSIEFDLQEVIWATASINIGVASFVTTEMQNVTRYQLAKNLINWRIKHPRLKADAMRAIDFFDQVRIRRNTLVHGMPVYDDNRQLTGRLAKFETKHGGGDVKITHLNVTTKYLNALVWDCWLCRQALTDASRKISRFLSFAEHDDGDALERHVFDYTDQPLDTDRLQIRLDQLRSVRPNQDTPEHPPAPSQA